MVEPPCESNACVGVLFAVTGIGEASVQVFDTKNPAGPWLVFNHEEWQAFIDRVKSGEYDL